MPHLAILTQYFPPEMGAPQARLHGLGEALVAGAGLVARPGDVSTLEQAYRLLARSSETRARLGDEGRDAALRVYDRRLIAERFDGFLRGLLSV